MNDLSTGGFVFITVFMLVRIFRTAFNRNYGMGFVLPVTSYFWLIGSLQAVTLVHLVDFIVRTDHDMKTREDFAELWQKSWTSTKLSYAAIYIGTLQCAYLFFDLIR